MPSSAKPATPPKAKKHEGCQVGDLFRLLGESHVLNILYVFLEAPGPRRFVDLQRQLKMSPNTLSDRLRQLVGVGLLTRTAYNEIPPRVEYEATTKAKEFKQVFRTLDEWATKNTLEPAVLPSP